MIKRNVVGAASSADTRDPIVKDPPESFARSAAKTVFSREIATRGRETQAGPPTRRRHGPKTSRIYAASEYPRVELRTDLPCAIRHWVGSFLHKHPDCRISLTKGHPSAAGERLRAGGGRSASRHR